MLNAVVSATGCRDREGEGAAALVTGEKDVRFD